MTKYHLLEHDVPKHLPQKKKKKKKSVMYQYVPLTINFIIPPLNCMIFQRSANVTCGYKISLSNQNHN